MGILLELVVKAPDFTANTNFFEPLPKERLVALEAIRRLIFSDCNNLTLILKQPPYSVRRSRLP
jgi:hypothetical protein